MPFLRNPRGGGPAGAGRRGVHDLRGADGCRADRSAATLYRHDETRAGAALAIRDRDGLDGIVAKRLDEPYRPGERGARMVHWRDDKPPRTMDQIVRQSAA